MKKFFCVFVASVMLISFCNVAEAFNGNHFLQINKEIIRVFTPMKDDQTFRDFEFQILMTVAHIKSMDASVRQGTTNQAKQQAAQIYAAILKSDYISMETYLKQYVIKKSNNPQATTQKCNKLLQLIHEASNALQN